MPLIATRGGASASGFGFCSGGAWRRVVLRNTANTPLITAGGETIIAFYNTLGFTYRSTDDFATNTLQATSTVSNLSSKGTAYAGTQHLYVNTSGFPTIYQCNPSTGVVSSAASMTGAYGASSNVQTDGSYYYIGVNNNGTVDPSYWLIYRSGTTSLNFTSPTNQYNTPDYGATIPGVGQIVKFGSNVYATPHLVNNGYSIYKSNNPTWDTVQTFSSGVAFPWMAANSAIIVAIVSNGTTRTIYTSTGSSFTSRLVLTSSNVNNLFWGGDAWYAYDSTGLAYSSPDGITWGLNSINLASGDLLGQGAADGNNKCIPFSNSGASVSGVYVKA